MAAGEVGELWVRAAQNVAASEGWLETGDLARQDADGYLFPTGRRSDGINRGGEKFAPHEVAEVLRPHPAVADVVVVGVPDPEMGERVGVAVVVRRRRPTPRPSTSCGTGAAAGWRPSSCPRCVVVVDALPSNELGKLPRAMAVDLIRQCEPRERPMTLYLHECHHVIGQHEDEFEAAFRDPGGWMDRLGQGDEARLLWYANQVHGTGPAYRVDHHHRRGRRGGLGAPAPSGSSTVTWPTGPARSIGCAARSPPRSSARSPGRPSRDLDLAAEPAEPADHEPTLFMEDTGWPHVAPRRLRRVLGRHLPTRARRASPTTCRCSRSRSAGSPCSAPGRGPRASCGSASTASTRLLALFTTEVPAERKAPGTYMADALDLPRPVGVEAAAHVALVAALGPA